MKKIFRINNKIIEEYGDVFVIAEAGVNHNQNITIALKLVNAAADAGADAVKFQTFKAEDVCTETGRMASYQMKNTGMNKSQRQLLKDLELPEPFYLPIIKRCREKKILFLSTPHGGKISVDLLEKFGVDAYKVGSGDLNNYIMVEKIAKLKKAIILGTGMATLKEVKDTVKFIKSCGNDKIIALHCTTNYPALREEVNLNAMVTMMNALDIPVGYSDHTLGNQTAIMAATLGAAAYECHLTLDKNLPGPDHKTSSTPTELKEKVRLIRMVKTIMGHSEKRPTTSEKASMLELVRKSIVAVNDIKKGQQVKSEDIDAKRPGDGLSPIHYRKLIGKKVRRDIKIDEKITISDVI